MKVSDKTIALTVAADGHRIDVCDMVTGKRFAGESIPIGAELDTTVVGYENYGYYWREDGDGFGYFLAELKEEVS
jgi:hypothetical protein